MEGPTTSCGQAARERQQVTVKDVAVADVFDDDARHAILQAGSRAAHSLPLTTRTGAVLGMVSSHHERPLTGLSGTQLAALDAVGGSVGQWLLWHRHTLVLDALEHLHFLAGPHADAGDEPPGARGPGAGRLPGTDDLGMPHRTARGAAQDCTGRRTGPHGGRHT